jgi:hypothetical protein
MGLNRPVQLKLASSESLDLAETFDMKASQLLATKTNKGSVIGIPEVRAENISEKYPQGYFRYIVSITELPSNSEMVRKEFARNEAGEVMCTTTFADQSSDREYEVDISSTTINPATTEELYGLFTKAEV